MSAEIAALAILGVGVLCLLGGLVEHVAAARLWRRADHLSEAVTRLINVTPCVCSDNSCPACFGRMALGGGR